MQSIWAKQIELYEIVWDTCKTSLAAFYNNRPAVCLPIDNNPDKPWPALKTGVTLAIRASPTRSLLRDHLPPRGMNARFQHTRSNYDIKLSFFIAQI